MDFQISLIDIGKIWIFLTPHPLGISLQFLLRDATSFEFQFILCFQ